MKFLLIVVMSASLRFTTAEDCVDKYHNCKKYSDNGQCWDHKLKKWMSARCPKTCEFCVPKCNLPLDIAMEQFSTLSYHSFVTYPTEAKLNISGGYRAKQEDDIAFKFVGVEFKKETILTGVATRGFGDPEVQEWVNEYIIKFIRQKSGQDEITEYILDSDGRPKLFKGNTDWNTTVRHNFEPENVKKVFIEPQTAHKNVAFRFELYGCIMAKSVVLWLRWRNENCTLEMLLEKKSDGFKRINSRLQKEAREISRLPGVQVVKLEHLRPGSLIVEFKVGVEDSQLLQMIAGVRKMIKSSSKFDANYLAVQDLQGSSCKTTNISFTSLSQVPESAFEIQRSYSHVINVFLASHTQWKAQVTWKIAHLHNSRNADVEGKSLFKSVHIVKQEEVVITNKTTLMWEILPRTLHYGIYYIEVMVEMKNASNCIYYNYGFLRIKESLLQVVVSASPSVEHILHGYYRELKLDASGSFDPDVLSADKSGFKYTWLCAQKGEEFGNIELLPVVTPDGAIISSNGKGCYGTGPGKLNFTDSTAMLFLDKMVAEKRYVIKLIVEKDRRKSNISYEFMLKTINSFGLEIRCKRNCKRKVDTNAKMAFEGICIGDVCKEANTKYTWSLYRKRDGSVVKTRNNKDIRLLEIEGGVLDEGEDYELKLDGYLTEEINSSQTHTFTTNESPSGGNCTVNKREGVVLETNFTFTCFAWKDNDRELTYQFGYTSNTGAHEIIHEGPLSFLKTNKLPLGDPEKDYEIRVDIYIKDMWGGFGKKSVTVRVLSSKTINVTTLYHYTVGNQSEMAKLMNSKDGGMKAMQLANTLLSVMSAASDNELKTEDKIKFKDEMIRHSSKVKVDDLQGLILVTSVVATATDQRDELSEESQWKSVDVLETMANKFKNISLINEKDPTGIKKAGNNLLLGIGNVLDASSMAVGTEEQEETAEEEGDKSKFNATKTKELAQKAWNLISKVGDSMLSSREVGDEPVEMVTKAISMVLNRQLPSDISNKPARIKDSHVTFPPPDDLLGSQAMDMSHVDTQMLSLKQNPFSWDKSAKSVKSAVISIDLKNDKGELLNVSGLSKEIELNIKTPAQQGQAPLQSFVKPSINGSMQYHRVMISTDGMAVSLKIVPQNGTTLQIYVRHSKRPTVENYTFMAEVPDFTSCKKRAKKIGAAASHPAVYDGYFNCTRDPHLVVLSSDVTGKLGLLFIGVRLPSSNDDSVKHKRRRRSCSENGRQKRSEICVEFKDPPTTPPPTPRINVPTYDPSSDVNYTLSISMGTCLYWSESKEKWTSDGCRVGPQSANDSLQCLCTHLSAFGGDFLVAPNPIDFDKVWDAFSNLLESKNFVVIGTVCAMLGLYAIAVVFARRADRSDSQKVTQVIPLGDVNTDNHCYELTIYTGLWRRCGTSANVAVMIYGEDRDTDIIPLNCSTMCNKKLFARGSVNRFMLSLKESLGDISHIKIWHDNSGDNPQWFINKVVIRDPNTDTTWFFVCNRWLAAERDDGKIERVLYVSTPAEINSFKNKFYSRAASGLGDGHIWLSVICRPPTSPFTRVQRVSCCLSVLMSAMVTNAMFYQFGAKETSNAFQIGPLILSWRQIIIGIQSAVLVVPINVFIVSIFRNIRPKDDVTQAYNTNSDNPKQTGEGTSKTGCKLPRFFLYVGWALCILTSLTSAAFTVFYSMMWGTEVSNKWLTSILVSFTQDVLFIQPIKVIIVASLLALIIKKAPEDDSVKEHQKAVAYSKVKGESDEPRKPDREQLEKFREYRVRVMTMARVAIELFFYLTFAWALMVICYGRRDTGHYWMTNGIDELLPRFHKVHNVDTFWEWTKKYFVPAMYDLKWYNGQPFEYKDGFISDLSGYMVGMPRFRQLRVKEGPCPIAPHYSEFRETLHPCLPPYGFTDEDQTRYSMPQWREISANETTFLSEFALLQMCPRPWRYYKADELHNLPFQGLRAMYGGGGFVADLGYTKGSALRVIHNLQNNSWIDEKTRAVFIEFMIFDSSTSLFSAVILLLETLPLGGITTFKRMNTMSLYGARAAGTRSFNAVCELIVILVVCYFIVAEIVKVCKQKCSYFKSAWSYVELAQILSATATVVLSIFRRYHTSKLVNKIHANPFETSSFHYAVLWSDLENALMAVLVFILTVKVLKILKFNEHISSLAASMTRCRDKIVSYSAVFFVAFLAFMQIALLVFGSTTKAYSSVSEVFRTQFGMFIGGDTNYRELKDANRIIGPIYFFLFMTAMACILINMFLAILNESYRDVRIYPEDRDTEEYKMLGVFLDYAKSKFGRKINAMKNTKLFPQTNSYKVKHTAVNRETETEDKYTPVNWTTYDFICQKHFDKHETDIESSFFTDIRRCLRNISSELKEVSLVPRSRKYEVYEIQKQFDVQEADLKTPCRGLGVEKISSKCSLFSLSESTMYIDKRKGRDSARRLLYNQDSSEVEDDGWDSGDSQSYTESMHTFFGKSGSVYDPERETFL